MGVHVVVVGVGVGEFVCYIRFCKSKAKIKAWEGSSRWTLLGAMRSSTQFFVLVGFEMEM